MLLALHRQATRSHRPSMAMPLAAAPYRASGLVPWHLADVGSSADVRFAPTAALLERPALVPKRRSRRSSTAALIGFTNESSSQSLKLRDGRDAQSLELRHRLDGYARRRYRGYLEAFALPLGSTDMLS